MKTAAICTIGDEILIGQIVDTNSSHIALELNRIGVRVMEMRSLADDRHAIYSGLDNLLRMYDIVITTGGLGPTKDDITKYVLAELSDSKRYVMHNGQLETVARILSARGIELTDINRNQALVPENAEVIVNSLGTAPAMVFRFPEGKYRHSPTLYSLPGVPFEAIALLPEVVRDMTSRNLLDIICHKTICTYGIPESTLAKMVERWEDALPEDMRLAYLPNAMSGVKMRLSLYGGADKAAMKRIDSEFNKIRPLLGESIYGEGEDTLYSFIANYMLEHKQTLSVAESCTGGKIASLFTSLPGASGFFYGSVTSYDNSVKSNVLGVSSCILEQYGAVSRECAEAMATGVRKVLGTDFGLSTTGIAGPDGGTVEKPVGTVWVAVAFTGKDGADRVESRKFEFSRGTRSVNIDRFSSNAVNFLRLTILHSSEL